VRLVDHDPGVRETISAVVGPSSQQEGSHAAGLAHTPGGHWRVDVLHGVIDTQTCRDGASCDTQRDGKDRGKRARER